VSQIVKLFAFQGIFWTKIWATMYLAFFLALELHVFVSKRCLSGAWPPTIEPADPEHIPRPSDFRGLPYISTALGAFFAVSFMIKAPALALSHRDRPINTADCTGIVLLICSLAIFVPSSYYSYVTRRDSRDLTMAQISLAVVLLIPVVYLLALVQHTTVSLAPQVSNYVMLGLILI
jgi:hypothetical protein